MVLSWPSEPSRFSGFSSRPKSTSTRILQPIVENAVRYAVAPRPAGGRIEVSAERRGETLVLVIEDDGPGLGFFVGGWMRKSSGNRFTGAATALVFGLFTGQVAAVGPASLEQTSPKALPTPPATPFPQEQKLQELKRQISGNEAKPAEAVFKNIQILRGLPAARLLLVMEIGYGRSLGVSCAHCHVPDAWEKDEKPAKTIAREMHRMMLAINNDYLKKIKSLSSEIPTVNCTTCHRGQTKPALNLP